MAYLALDTINAREQIALDAPTGTGKSYAYAAAIVESGRKAIIATPTKALTAQLADKDIPAVAHAAEIGYAELLGRNNYTCVASSGQDNGCEGTCDSDDECAYQRALEKALESALVVTTLDKLFYMLLRPGRTTVALLENRVIVIDEADCIDEAATRVFGADFKAGMFGNLAQRIERMKPPQVERLTCTIDEAVASANVLRAYYVQWWKLMLDEYTKRCPSQRPIEMLYETVVNGEILGATGLLLRASREFCNVMQTDQGAHPMADTAYEQLNDLPPAGSNYLLTLQGEYGGGMDTTVLHKGVIETGKVIAPLLGSIKPLILTSATLAPSELMHFQVGIDMPLVSFDSPFNLIENRKAFIADQVKAPRGGRMSWQERQQAQARHTNYVADIAAQFADTHHGRTMVLFSSIKEMQDAAYRLRNETDFNVLTQKDSEDAQWAVGEFKEDGGAGCILLGSASYMRGVDLPGSQLKAVIIAKAPLARYDALGKARLQHFIGYLDATAQRVLNQCAGRLIRAIDDDGDIVLCEGGRYAKLFELAVTPSRVVNLNQGEWLW